MQKQARNKYKEVSNGEKDIKREYGRNWYRNTQEKNKEKSREFQKSYCNKQIMILSFYCVWYKSWVKK